MFDEPTNNANSYRLALNVNKSDVDGDNKVIDKLKDCQVSLKGKQFFPDKNDPNIIRSSAFTINVLNQQGGSFMLLGDGYFNIEEGEITSGSIELREAARETRDR